MNVKGKFFKTTHCLTLTHTDVTAPYQFGIDRTAAVKQKNLKPRRGLSSA